METTLTICDTFRARAFATWDLLGRASTVASPLGEETLTDLNLLELKTRHPREVITHSFSKPEEGTEGADWEWWLTGPTGQWLGFRVQAKAIDVPSLTFPHLHYRRSKRVTHQCDQLIQRALTAKPRRIPLYCLYCFWPDSTLPPPWRCGSFSATRESFGCSIMSAVQVSVLRQGAAPKSLAAIGPHAWPWHCLVCCNGFGQGDLPHRGHAFWSQAIMQADLRLRNQKLGADTQDFLTQLPSIEVTQNPPPYVISILEGSAPERPDEELRIVSIFQELGA